MRWRLWSCIWLGTYLLKPTILLKPQVCSYEGGGELLDFPWIALAKRSQDLAAEIRTAIYTHAVVDHPVFGKMFAYEVGVRWGSVS